MDHADWLAGIDCTRHRAQWCDACCPLARSFTHRSTVSAPDALAATRPARGSRKERLAEVASEQVVLDNRAAPTNVAMPRLHMANLDGSLPDATTVWLVVTRADGSLLPEGHVTSLVGFRGQVIATYTFGRSALVRCENFAYADVATSRLQFGPDSLVVVRFHRRSSASMAAERLAA